MARIAYLTAIDFGPGEIAGLSEAVAQIGMARPLLISDEGIAAAGLLDRAWPMIGGPVFLGTPPNPTEDASARRRLGSSAAEGCDGIVAVGGGSPIDLGQGGSAARDASGAARDGTRRSTAGMPRITAAVAPVIASPDNGGNRGGGRAGGAPDARRTGASSGFISPHLIPKRAICDPELTLGLPP